jgi:hypothetical protein
MAQAPDNNQPFEEEEGEIFPSVVITHRTVRAESSAAVHQQSASIDRDASEALNLVMGGIEARGRGRVVLAQQQAAQPLPSLIQPSISLAPVISRVTPIEQRALDSTIFEVRRRYSLMTPGGREHFLRHIGSYLTPSAFHPRGDLLPLRQPRNPGPRRH